MKVRTERTTTRGESVVEMYEGELFVHPPHSRPAMDGQKLLGRVTAVTDVGSGRVTLESPDGDLRTYEEITAVKLPPMVEKVRLEFTALSPKMLRLGHLIGIEHGNESPDSQTD
ncbi:hypothetical protein HCTV-15_gp58 [Haloarcula virus HCTV-15]|nr:hypothetical protein HCTV-6_gp58 [Haloarcula virus HCTV-6]UBF22532.1 hypothetical protein HCTV-15_gp58 [Haloarcula virus HCTV-15]